MSNEPTLQDVLEAVKTVEKNTETRFDEVLEVVNTASTETETRFQTLESKMETGFKDLKQELNKQKLDILDAMDDKLVNLKGDLILVMRKEDHKLAELVGILKQRRVITDDDVRRILGMEPFPQISI